MVKTLQWHASDGIVDGRGYLVDQHEEKVGLIEGECNVKPHFLSMPDSLNYFNAA